MGAQGFEAGSDGDGYEPVVSCRPGVGRTRRRESCPSAVFRCRALHVPAAVRKPGRAAALRQGAGEPRTGR